MFKLDINIKAKMPDQLDDNYKQPSLQEKCEEYMEVCESAKDSKYHFDYLKAVYGKLCNHKDKKLSDLKLKLEEFFMKHGSVDNSPDNQVDLDHRTLEKLK